MTRLAVTLAAATALPALGCDHDLAHHVDDGALTPVPPADRQAVFAAQADLDKARKEKEYVERLLKETDGELDIARKEKVQADAEIDKQKIEEDLARQSNEPVRLNAAFRWKHMAGLKQKVADAHADFVSLRGRWLDEALEAAKAHILQSDAKLQLERASLCAKRGIRPYDEFNPIEFEAQFKEEDEAWRKEQKEAEEADKRAKDAEERWKKITVEYKAFGGT